MTTRDALITFIRHFMPDTTPVDKPPDTPLFKRAAFSISMQWMDTEAGRKHFSDAMTSLVREIQCDMPSQLHLELATETGMRIVTASVYKITQ